MSKTAIIIGATSGIGRELAVRLLEMGWKVGITGRREDRLFGIRDRFGADAVAYAVMDITQEDAVSQLDKLLEETGAPDLFLHVSGVGYQNPLLDEAVEMQVIQTNCDGMVRVVTHFLNYVKKNPSYSAAHLAHIGVVTSVAGTAGLGIAAAYSASKKMQSTYVSALVQLSRMQHWPVVFSDIRPGFVATEILNASHNYPLIMPVEKAAAYILKGLKRKRRIITFDWRFRLITAFWKGIPRWLWERLTFIKTGH